jgi:hypothetical protein
MAKHSITTSRQTRLIGIYPDPLLLRATDKAHPLQLLLLQPLSVLLALHLVRMVVQVAVGLVIALSPTFPPMKSLSLCVRQKHCRMRLYDTHCFQMIGTDHAKYAQAIKQRQIKGIVLASSNDDELIDILRYESSFNILTEKPNCAQLPAYIFIQSRFEGT